jgi:hypothetical protein
MGLDDVVTVVPWTLTASDGARTFTYGSRLALPDPDPQAFIPFAKLTEDVVCKWVEESPSLDMDYIKASLAAEFARKTAPPPVSTAYKKLPFLGE